MPTKKIFTHGRKYNAKKRFTHGRKYNAKKTNDIDKPYTRCGGGFSIAKFSHNAINTKRIRNVKNQLINIANKYNNLVEHTPGEGNHPIKENNINFTLNKDLIKEIKILQVDVKNVPLNLNEGTNDNKDSYDRLPLADDEPEDSR